MWGGGKRKRNIFKGYGMGQLIKEGISQIETNSWVKPFLGQNTVYDNSISQTGGHEIKI